MDLYVITESGRKSLKKLWAANNFRQAEILGYIDLAGRVNITQITYATHLPEDEVQKELKSFVANRWVRLDKSRTTPF